MAKTPKVNVTELRQNLPSYLARVRKGEAVEVTVRGRVIARIVPEEDRRAAARKRLKALRKTAYVGDVMSPSGEKWDAELGRY
jgi:prevent-host-death family protein